MLSQDWLKMAVYRLFLTFGKKRGNQTLSSVNFGQSNAVEAKYVSHIGLDKTVSCIEEKAASFLRCRVVANMKWSRAEVIYGARSVLVVLYHGRQWRNAAMVARCMYPHSQSWRAAPPVRTAVRSSPLL